MGNSQSMPQHHEDSSSKLSQCPVHQLNNEQQTTTSTTTTKINEDNNIPELAQAPSPGQRTKLSLDRELSSIPLPSKSRSSATSSPENSTISACPINHQTGEIKQQNNKEKETWVYPSPQQFYNALVRKGWETPEEAIPVMVDIHNWMNEAVWNEVLRWESRYFFNPSLSTTSTKFTPVHQPEISLVKFQGRPHDLSPKARFNILLSKIFPNLYNPIKPFDRHDWSIRREHLFSNDDHVENHHQHQGIEKSKLNRYVIDYYNGGVDEHGNPVFHFDVRPAIDDFDSLVVRLKEWARVKNESWFTNTTTDSPHSNINSTSINVDTDSKT
ncbi:hypothetical protein MJO28_009907 [Puccinia striiformis f. sp. tritici]|uniref:Holocytochrome c-type synthase n=2 Tax=Puccinia striiformis f. sp. tritici TaxID=168172 RepID=A0A0L0W591_9BASI|nr:hypothetical protein Pst134EB_018187 [Puccinia striiformis f. sp. tritici]KAI7947999.1 hypothetical protein MJO28_009907 [Puccinia striiformis f. sp. tritici]KNF06681.1 hypothetical protein PSTG_00556 [Puccinia striiformis f. sp. tritici PST-78]